MLIFQEKYRAEGLIPYTLQIQEWNMNTALMRYLEKDISIKNTLVKERKSYYSKFTSEDIYFDKRGKRGIGYRYLGYKGYLSHRVIKPLMGLSLSKISKANKQKKMGKKFHKGQTFIPQVNWKKHLWNKKLSLSLSVNPKNLLLYKKIKKFNNFI
jgi:hypothetical protein